MRPGGSSAKGAAFERAVCRQLSLWVSNNTRDDLFSRNVLSGGQFTASSKRGAARGRPGDIAGIDPLGAPFLKTFVVECKHRADIGLRAFANDDVGNSWLSGVIKHTFEQALLHDAHWLIVAKENRQKTLVFLPSALAELVTNGSGILCHAYHLSDTRIPQSICCRFDDLLAYYTAAEFIKAAVATL